MLDFRVHTPPAALAPYVRFAWELEGVETGTERIVPDGCVELVLNLADPFEQITSDVAIAQPRVLVVGEVERPVVTRPTGRVHLLGVRFAPGAGQLFVSAKMPEIAGTMRDDAALGPDLRACIDRVRSAAPIDRTRLLFEGLLAAIRDRRDEDRLVRRAAQRIAASRGAIAIEALTSELDVTRRHLERRFREATGMTPKGLAQVVRFRAVLAALDGERWSRAATAAGYYDQSHLIRDFKRFTGTTPRAYLREGHPLAILVA